MASSVIPLETLEFLAQDRSGQLVGTSIAAIVSTTIVLVTRFFAKRFQGGGFYWDDGFLLSAYVVNLGMCALGISMWSRPSLAVMRLVFNHSRFLDANMRLLSL